MRELMIRAFVEPFDRLGHQFAQIVPAVIAVVIVLAVGAVIAHFARYAVYRLLVAAHFDRLAARIGLAAVVERIGVFRSASDFIARLVEGLLWLVVILIALDSTGTPAAEGLVVRFVNYVPALLSAALILLLGSMVSKFLARSALLAAVNAQWPAARAVAGVVRIMVMALTVAIALEELRIGKSVLLVTFGILFAGIVIAGAVAFGLGARDLAREWLQSKVNHRSLPEEEAFRHF
jgi:hypothetical protein